MRRVRGLPAAAAAVMLLAGCGTATLHQVGADQRGTPSQPATAVSAMKPCTPPEYSAGPAPGQGLNGPAVADLTGGADTAGFSLDGGSFSIKPPPAGDAPRVSRTLAECEALAAVASDGEPFIYADGVSQMAVGYGLVTVAAGLPVNSWQGHYPGMTLPTPAPAVYQSRLAWVAAFRITDRANCPGVSQTSAPSPGGAYNGYYYEVFIIDAVTGGDALAYDEAAPGQCSGPGLSAPSVGIPVELTSVRWELDSRGPGDAFATLTAYVPPCLDYDKQVALGFDSDLVAVLAYGQVAASCGPPRPVVVQLKPAPGLQSLLPRLAHAATGLYLTGTGEQQLP